MNEEPHRTTTVDLGGCHGRASAVRITRAHPHAGVAPQVLLEECGNQKAPKLT